MNEAWRLLKKSRRATAFTGEGARLYGGRWNHRGTAMVYLADSLSLAVLESFVHLIPAEKKTLCFAYQIMIPDQLEMDKIILEQLPANWRALPAPEQCKDVGTDWVAANQSVALVVPSVLVPVQFNILLNPEHPDFDHIQIEEWGDFSFDPRMWK